MRSTTPLMTLGGTVAGIAAAVVAYQAAAGSGTAKPAPTQPVSVTNAADTAWLPCEPGWTLHGDTCVAVKEETQVVNDLPAPAPAPSEDSSRLVAPASTPSGERVEPSEPAPVPEVAPAIPSPIVVQGEHDDHHDGEDHHDHESSEDH